MQFLIYITFSLLPTILFYGYGVFFTDALKGQAEIKFLPQLLLLPAYWKGWLQTAIGSVGHIALIAGLAGLLVLRKGMPKALMIGLWIGYVLFGLVFHIQIHFVDYYHLQLIVIVGLSIGPLVALIIDHSWPSLYQWYWRIPVIAVLTLVVLLNFRTIHNQLTTRQLGYDEAVAREIGEIVGHSQNTVYLAHHYGTPLEYYGELSGTFWPRRVSEQDLILGRRDAPERTVEERFQTLGFLPEYFIITNFTQFDRNHADLKEYLVENCHLVAGNDQYLIYRDCKI